MLLFLDYFFVEEDTHEIRRLFLQLVIFSSFLIVLIYFGFFLNNHYFAALCVCCLTCPNN